MIDPSQSVYYMAYGIISISIGILYFKIKSTEGIIITTNEFKIFQTGYLTGYAMMILGELMSTACFFHIFIYLELSIEQITKLYIITIMSTTIFSLAYEIIDIGSRKNKCFISAILYVIATLTVFFGGHYEMLLIGRVVYGAATALHHTSFETYILHEHTTQGFPDDWLNQTFTLISHSMSAIAVLSGGLGQTAAGNSPLSAAFLCCCIFTASGVYIYVVWNKDNFNHSKFMLSQFISNINQTIQTTKSNKQMLYLLGITSFCEAAITIFTFYWALWLYGIAKVENGHKIPYEIIFSSFITMSMIGNYLYKLFANNYESEVILQGILLVTTGAFFMGSVAMTPMIAFIIALVIQLCVGGYWSSVGQLRGRLVMPELKSSVVAICRVLTLLISSSVLTLIHYNSFLTLSACASLFGAAAYLHTLLTQTDLKNMQQYAVDDEDFEEES